MSRVGNAPVAIPSGVTVEIKGQTVTAKGKRGTLAVDLDREVRAEMADGKLRVIPSDDSKTARMRWGTARNLIKNMVDGVSAGYTVNLELVGVGYRAQVQGKMLNLQLGFSHDVKVAIPEGITMACEKPTTISISGSDRRLVGQIAANLRRYREPEPYKGKGVKYEGEQILRKEGKKK